MSKEEKRIIVLDSTILNTLQLCPYKTFLSFVKNLSTQETPEVFERGDFIHFLLETYYKALRDGTTKEEAFKLASDKGKEKYVEYTSFDINSAEWALHCFEQYHNRWLNDGIKVLEVEESFIMKVFEDDELEAYYAGKIDLVAELPLVGAVPIDHKSRTRMNEETILNNQFIGYAINKASNYVYVNEFGLQSSKDPDEKFRRIPLSYPDNLKEHWMNNIVRYWVKQLDYYLQEQVWPEIWGAHCKNCIFSQVCKSGSIDEKVRKLKTNYIIKEAWDVSKILEGKNE